LEQDWLEVLWCTEGGHGGCGTPIPALPGTLPGCPLQPASLQVLSQLCAGEFIANQPGSTRHSHAG